MTTRVRTFFILLCAMLGLMMMTAQAQSSNTWSAQFYNNTTFSGSPAATTTVTNLNINWGNGAPATGVGVDNWTARFNTVSYFNAGTYRFIVHADDAFRLHVHGQLLIDTISNPQPDTVRTVDYSPGAGNAGIQIDFREYIGVAFLNVSWHPLSIVQPPTPTSQPVGVWTAQFFNNTSLSGTATALSGFNDLNINWGSGAPAVGIGSDNWTARFTGTPYFNPGMYRFTINADDAFRLYVGNRLVLDTFSNPRPNTPISTDVQVYGGNTWVQIDYREYIGPAFLYVSWQPVTVSQPPTQPPQQPLTPAVVINTGALNFRSAPAVADNIIGRLLRGERYPLLGRTSSSDWYQIQVGNNAGWVSARYVIAQNANNVPVVNQPPPPTPAPITGYSLRSRANLSIRSGPAITYRRLNVLPYNGTANIIGRNSSSTWWLIQYGWTTGWVSGSYVTLPANLNVAQVPVR